MKTPLNKKTLQQHWRYNWWKYVILIAGTCFAWNLIFTMTAYRSPADKVVDVYIYSLVESETMQAYLDEIHANEMSDMEQMECAILYADETYGDMVLMTRVAAAEGDVYILPKAQFQSYAGQGALVAFEDYPEILQRCEEAGLNLERGTYRVTEPEPGETAERRTYGIPLSQLPGLCAKIPELANAENYFVCALYANGNDANTMKLIDIMVRDGVIVPAAEETATPTEIN